MASTEQLERETEQTRARLAETLEELRSMTPGRVLDEVLEYAKEGGGDFMRNLGTQVVENPLPATLIGAGIAWYVMSNGKASAGTSGRPNGNGQGWSDETSYGIETGTMAEAGQSAWDAGRGLGNKASSTMRSVKETAQSAASSLSNAASTVTDKASSAYDAMSSTASRTAESVKSAATSVAQSTAAMQESAMATTRSMLDFAKDQPLVLIGLGLALGAALGTALPETETEDRLMGETADEVKDKAQQLASEQLEIAKNIGGRVVDQTTDAAKQGLSQIVDAAQSQIQGDQASVPSDQENASPGQDQQSGDGGLRPQGESSQPFH